MLVTEKTVKLELSNSEVTVLTKAMAVYLISAAPHFPTMDRFTSVHHTDGLMLSALADLAGMPGFYKQTVTSIQLAIGTATNGRRKRASATIVKEKAPRKSKAILPNLGSGEAVERHAVVERHA